MLIRIHKKNKNEIWIGMMNLVTIINRVFCIVGLEKECKFAPTLPVACTTLRLVFLRKSKATLTQVGSKENSERQSSGLVPLRHQTLEMATYTHWLHLAHSQHIKEVKGVSFVLFFFFLLSFLSVLEGLTATYSYTIYHTRKYWEFVTKGMIRHEVSTKRGKRILLTSASSWILLRALPKILYL